MAPKAAAELVLKIAKAIYEVHMCQIIHRDLKPANVLLESEQGWELKLTDFGLAKVVDQDISATATGSILGTPASMSHHPWLDAISVYASCSCSAAGGARARNRPIFSSTSTIRS